MGEEHDSFNALQRAGQRELFHLQNGLDITSLRDLVLQLRMMEQSTFQHHVNEERNDFATWIKEVFGDETLADSITDEQDKNRMADTVESHLLELEQQELERYGAHLPSNDLQTLEEYIEKQLREGNSEEHVKSILLRKGWEEKTVDLVLVGKNNPYREYASIHHIEDIDRFHHILEQVKKSIIDAIAKGSSFNDIKSFLARQGWHEEIVDFIFYDIFKPHPNIKKLSHFIIHQVKDKNRNVQDVKRDLIKLGWKEYIIDSVIYGINTPDNSLQRILSYLEEFSEDNEERVKRFLLEMGWKEIDINDAIKQKQLEAVKKRLQESFNIDGGDALKERSEMINSHIILLRDDKDLWKKLTQQYKRVSISDFQKHNGELHMEDDYTYYYAEDDMSIINGREGKNITTAHYEDPTKPLLVEHRNKYLLLPRIIHRRCVVCDKLFPINHMKKIEMWDESRTHKVTKYVCEKHERQIESFLDETKIVQS
ncbi:hypothetical protein JXA12_00520 [Candidatus Woesearchaeota archaeon]|nr:hypothetical protein [Candidatus Woesearchaeota archaeon]